MDRLSKEILAGYHIGLFPMADARDDPTTSLIDPNERGQLAILDLHIPRRLLRTVRSNPYTVKINTAFDRIIDLCAETPPTQNGDRNITWINDTIRTAFLDFHRAGLAHSVEMWQDDQLVGGLYGLALGQVFCGESMVSRARDTSKIALVHLCARLYTGGFQVLDAQFTNDHLQQFGIYDVPRATYQELLIKYRDKPADFIQPERSVDAILAAYLAARTGPIIQA